MSSPSLFNNYNLSSPSFVGKSLAAAALVGAGLYLYNANKEQIKAQQEPASDKTWTLFENPTVLLIIWIVVLVVLAYVWHKLCSSMGLDEKQIQVVNLLMVSLLVLLFAGLVSYTSGEVSTAYYLMLATALGALVATFYLWYIKQTHGAIAMAVVTAYLAYRVFAMYAVYKPDGADGQQQQQVHSHEHEHHDHHLE